MRICKQVLNGGLWGISFNEKGYWFALTLNEGGYYANFTIAIFKKTPKLFCYLYLFGKRWYTPKF